MSDENKEKNIKEYADGWITEREGTDVPGFLKLAYPIIGLFCCAYLVVYMNGEVGHSDRGLLVQAFNKVTGTADGLMYFVTALAVIYVVIAVLFALRKSDH
jgi:hypothetical protein